MKLGRFTGLGITVAASALSWVAVAQTAPQTGGLNIPDTIQFVGKQEPGVRKATAEA